MQQKYFDVVLGDGSRVAITVNLESDGLWRAALNGTVQPDSDVGATAMESAFRMAANLMLFDSLDVREVVMRGTVSRSDLVTMRNTILSALR